MPKRNTNYLLWANNLYRDVSQKSTCFQLSSLHSGGERLLQTHVLSENSYNHTDETCGDKEKDGNFKARFALHCKCQLLNTVQERVGKN